MPLHPRPGVEPPASERQCSRRAKEPSRRHRRRDRLRERGRSTTRIFRRCRPARSDRVAFDIHHDSPHCRALHRTRIVASLPQVAAAGRSSVPIARVIAVNPAESARQRFSGLRHSEQMDVIAHETPGPNLQAVLMCVFAQEPQVDMMVLRVVEDCLPAIAALSNVVRHALQDDPSDSWHLEKRVRVVVEKSRRNRYLSVLSLI